MKSKYLGKVYDGMWKVVNTYRRQSNTNYILENTYNKTRYEINPRTMVALDKGQTTMSRIIAHNIRNNKDRRIKMTVQEAFDYITKFPVDKEGHIYIEDMDKYLEACEIVEANLKNK